MWRFFYNLFLPIGFLFFLPGVLYKYRHRGGWKDTFSERFGRFSPERKKELAAFHGAIWVHSVSVGETVLALSMIEKYLLLHPERKFIISTTTTTGQEMARKKQPANTSVIFCPIDFPCMVKRTLNIIKPSMLVIFETELWPNMISIARKANIPVALVNGRMSDHSSRGYRRARFFFAPMLKLINRIMVQSQVDEERFLAVSPEVAVEVTGNMKFDQAPPENLKAADLDYCFGSGKRLVLLAASTHPGEEALIVDAFCQLKKNFADLKLVIVPRHAERGADIAEHLKSRNLSFVRRSLGEKPETPVEILLADTTGEMFSFIAAADVVIVGKSLAGHDEGHNLIEPALLGKPIVTGAVLRNFRFIFDVLANAEALAPVARDIDLVPVLADLFGNPERRQELGKRAEEAISKHRGAALRTIEVLEKLLAENK